MQKLAFFELSRPVQERFVEAARGAATPAPLAFRPAFARRVALWSALSLLGVTLVFGVAMLGYGRLSSSLAIAPTWMLGLYAALLAFAGLCAVEALAARWARSKLPYRPGVYLFPSGIVDASVPRFSVYRLVELDLSADGRRRVKLHKGGASFSFETPDAELALRSLLEYKQRLQAAEQSGDTRDLIALDPLKETGFVSPFSPPTPIRRPRPGWFSLALPLAIAAGLPLGWLVWSARNAASENALYERARQEDDVEAYQAYLARGGQRADVAEILLPRAELERARQSGGTEAIEEFVARRPNSKVHDEAMAALKAALLVELERAKASKSLREIRSLPERHPRHTLIQAELAQAIRDAYAGAFERYAKHAPAADEGTRSFVKRLLAHAETHGPVVQIRFVEHLPDGHDLADIAVKNSMYFAGTRSLPSQYFEDEDVAAREKKAGEALAAELQRAFSPEILKFELGPRLKNQDVTAIQPERPSLFIEHATRLSGTYVSERPRGIFMGISMMFEASFRIPKDPAALHFKHAAWNPPNMDVLKQDDSPGAVYDASQLDAFSGFNRKLTSKLLAKP